MNKEQFIKGLKYLGIAYNKEFNEEQATVWYDFFKDTDFEVFRQAVKRIIPKSKYMPSIAELRGEIASITNPVLQLDVDKEWEKVLTVIRRYGTYITREQFDDAFNSTTKGIIEVIGWRKLCLSENIEFQRKIFYDMFNNLQKRNEDASVMQVGMLTSEERLMLNEGTMQIM